MGRIAPGKRQVGLSLWKETADWLRVTAARRGKTQSQLVEAAVVLLAETIGHEPVDGIMAGVFLDRPVSSAQAHAVQATR